MRTSGALNPWQLASKRADAMSSAEQAIMGSAGSFVAIAGALVAEARTLTGGSASSLLEMRGGQWVRTAVSGGTERAITVTLSRDEVTNGPILIEDTSRHPHPLARIAWSFGIPSVAVVPIHLWPPGPALLSVSAAEAGDLRWEDLGTLSTLVVIAEAAAYQTPLDPAHPTRPLQDLGWHQETLERIARGAPVEETLSRVCLEIERRYPETRSSILVANKEQGVLRHAAAPTLPTPFCEAIDGMPIEEGAAACGSAAATRQPVVIRDIAADPRTSRFFDLALKHRIGSVWSYPLVDSKSEVVGTFALYRDGNHTPDAEEMGTVAAVASLAALAIERSETEAALTEAAQQDPLTGLSNRTRFASELAAALDTARRDSTSCAVIFLDLDGFKFINDGLGHAAGDRILVEIAGRLTRVLGPGGAVARFGGDEFTVLIEDVTNEGVQQIADSISSALQEPFVLDGGEFIITTAFGIAISSGVDSDPESVIRDADAAMYVAKSRGRGQRAFFDTAVHDRAVARMKMEGELRRVVYDDLIQVDYQPILDIASVRWCGVEALARWRPSSSGEVAPGDFIPLAEEIGLVARLGHSVMRDAIRQAATWDSSGIAVPVAVNVSAVQLADPEIADQILELVDTFGIRPELLTLEITESAVMASPDLARRLLTDLRADGIRAVIDDFGTGYSSIARLNELPAVGIKIDRSFTAALTSSANSVAVVSAVIQLAHAFGMVVTAEGVESAVQFHILEDLGCDRVQGYLFAQPVDEKAVARILRTPPQVPGSQSLA